MDEDIAVRQAIEQRRQRLPHRRLSEYARAAERLHHVLGYDPANIKLGAFVVAAVDTWVRRYDRRTRIRASVPHADGVTTLLGEGPYVIVSNSGISLMRSG